MSELGTTVTVFNSRMQEVTIESVMVGIRGFPFKLERLSSKKAKLHRDRAYAVHPNYRKQSTLTQNKQKGYPKPLMCMIQK